MGQLLNWHEDLATKNMMKAEIFSAFFALDFTGKTDFQEPQLPVIRRKIWSSEDLPSVKKD